MDVLPGMKTLVIAGLPANNVRLKLYHFEQRESTLIHKKHFNDQKTIDTWIYAAKKRTPYKPPKNLQDILQSLHPLTQEDMFLGHVVAAVRIRIVEYAEATILRDQLCPGVHLSKSAHQILYYEKIVPLLPIPVHKADLTSGGIVSTLPISTTFRKKCLEALKIAQGIKFAQTLTYNLFAYFNIHLTQKQLT